MNTKTLEKTDALSDRDVRSSGEWLIGRSELCKRSACLLVALVGIPLVVAMCLLLQLHKLPDSSLSYSLLNATVSLLFNFSSSAFLKALSFLTSLVGLSRWAPSSAR
jgi:hypothetical protein